jgi:inner membrane protein
LPSLFGHAAAGIALGAAFAEEGTPRKTMVLGTLCALAPDLDWFTAFLRLHPGNYLAHRGVTHSLLGAVLLAAAVLLLGFKREQRTLRLATYLLLASLSHGLLDACTSGNIGVAFFYPFSSSRWACDWQPIQDAPLPFWPGLRLPFLGALLGEMLWIGVPAFLLVAETYLFRHFSNLPLVAEAEPEG